MTMKPLSPTRRTSRVSHIFKLAVVITIGAACSSAGGSMQSEQMPGATGTVSVSSAETMLAAWPEKQRESARMLIAKYGQPNVSGDRMLVWYNKGAYKKIALSRDEQMHNFPMPHPDYLASTVMHSVPAGKLDELARYDGSVWFHRTRGELTAQCDKEEMNNLALNLAHEIAMGRRTVDDARAFYAKTAMAFMNGDKSSPYVTGIMFQQQTNAADPDTPAKM